MPQPGGLDAPTRFDVTCNSWAAVGAAFAAVFYLIRFYGLLPSEDRLKGFDQILTDWDKWVRDAKKDSDMVRAAQSMPLSPEGRNIIDDIAHQLKS